MVAGLDENTALSDAEMIPEPLMTIPPGVVPPAVQFQLQLQLQLQELGAGQKEDGRQDGVVGGNNGSSPINEAFYNLNQIVDGDIDLDPNLHPASPVESSIFRMTSPVLDPLPSFSIHPSIHPSTNGILLFLITFIFPFPSYTHLQPVCTNLTFLDGILFADILRNAQITRSEHAAVASHSHGCFVRHGVWAAQLHQPPAAGQR